MTSDPSVVAAPAAKLIDGRPLARRLLADAAHKVQLINAQTGVTPTLATVLIGNDPASATYIRMKCRRCSEVGMRSVKVELPYGTTTDELIARIRALGADPAVHGILVQHPVPAPLDKRAAFEAISVEKDVDGVTSTTLGRTILGLPAYSACTPTGIMLLLREYAVELPGTYAVVLGRSPILGRPMASLLINAHATVTLCHSHTRDLPHIIGHADLLIAAVGKPRFVQGHWLKSGAVVIDAGYNPSGLVPADAPGSAGPGGSAVNVPATPGRAGARIIGDVDFEAALPRVRLITPVPGGVGPMTIAVLINQTADAAAKQLGVAL